MSEETKYCQYCGGEISANAVMCVHCKKILNEEKQPVENKGTVEQNEDDNVIHLSYNVKGLKQKAKEILHSASLWICIVSALYGCGMLFQNSINIADGVMYICMWICAIFFLMVWKVTE